MVSDTHGFLDSRITDLLSECTIAIHAGDIGGAQVLESLNSNCEVVFAVAGNNDAQHIWKETEWEVLQSLPEVHHIVLRCGVVTVEHGHRVRDTRRYHDELRQRHHQSTLIVYGHTHVRVIDQCELPWVVNPGASGKERTHGGPSCLIIEMLDNNMKVFEHCFES